MSLGDDRAAGARADGTLASARPASRVSTLCAPPAGSAPTLRVCIPAGDRVRAMLVSLAAAYAAAHEAARNLVTKYSETTVEEYSIRKEDFDQLLQRADSVDVAALKHLM
ncbi:MAG: hypothetical protein AAFS07_19215, partial [Pseudomonadota bacterium]